MMHPPEIAVPGEGRSIEPRPRADVFVEVGGRRSRRLRGPSLGQYAHPVGRYPVVQHELAETPVVAQRGATATAGDLLAIVRLEHEVTIQLHTGRPPDLLRTVVGHG